MLRLLRPKPPKHRKCTVPIQGEQALSSRSDVDDDEALKNLDYA